MALQSFQLPVVGGLGIFYSSIPGCLENLISPRFYLDFYNTLMLLLIKVCPATIKLAILFTNNQSLRWVLRKGENKALSHKESEKIGESGESWASRRPLDEWQTKWDSSRQTRNEWSAWGNLPNWAKRARYFKWDLQCILRKYAIIQLNVHSPAEFAFRLHRLLLYYVVLSTELANQKVDRLGCFKRIMTVLLCVCLCGLHWVAWR